MSDKFAIIDVFFPTNKLKLTLWLFIINNSILFRNKLLQTAYYESRYKEEYLHFFVELWAFLFSQIITLNIHFSSCELNLSQIEMKCHITSQDQLDPFFLDFRKDFQPFYLKTAKDWQISSR